MQIHTEFDTGQEYNIAGHPRIEERDKIVYEKSGTGCFTLVLSMAVIVAMVILLIV